jgi:hypothetical protein
MNYGTQKDCEVNVPDGYHSFDNGNGTWTIEACIFVDIRETTEEDAYIHIMKKCEICGYAYEVSKVEKFELYKSSISMANSLKFNFAFKQEGINAGEGYKVVIKHFALTEPTKKDEVRQPIVNEIVINYNEWKTSTIGGVSVYVVGYDGISAKQMNDILQVVIYDENGVPVSKIWEDSLVLQSKRNLTANTSVENQMLVKALLKYGAEAQTYFGYREDNLANADVGDIGINVEVENNQKISDIGAEYFVASRAIYADNIVLEFKFNFGRNNTISENAVAIVSYVDSTGVKHKKEIKLSDITNASGSSVVSVDTLKPADCRQDVTVSIVDGDEILVTVTDSLASYAARVKAKGMASANLALAMVQYGDAAKEYLASKKK